MQYVPTVGLRRTTPPNTTPITVRQAQDWLGLAAGTDDNLLRRLILGMTDIAEKHTKRALITQSWTMSLDEWPGGVVDWWDAWHAVTLETSGDNYLELPYAPLQSVTSVTTYDVDDASTSITVGDYFIVDTNAEPGRMVLRSTQSWPVDTRIAVRAEIVYVSGYGDDDADVPYGVKQGILNMVAWQYEHRGDCDAGSVLAKSGALSALAPYRIMEVC